MKKKIKVRLLPVILSAVLVLISACSGGAGTNSTGKDESGGYIQESLSMPDDITECYAMTRLADGTIRMIGSGGICDSVDNGNSWQPYDYHSALLDELTAVPEEDSENYSELYPDCITIHTDGTVFVTMDKAEEDPTDPEYYSHEVINAVITPDGTETLLTIELPEDQTDTSGVWSDGDDSIISGDDEPEAEEDADSYERTLTRAVFADDNRLVGTDIFTGELFVIDLSSGDILDTFHVTEDYIEEFAVYEDRLIVRTWGMLEVFDLETGEITAGMPALEAFFNTEHDSNFTFMPDDENGALYAYESNGGIYKFTEAVSEPELLVDASSNALANSDISMDHVLLLEDESFLAVAERRDSGRIELICFSYTDEIPESELSLTVYSLTEDLAIRRCVTNFQELYPQYEVSYVYGLDDQESSLTLTDVLKNLNTEILAGSGPDIIMMDGISIDSYIEKDALADLSEILFASDDEYFTNVLETYSASDGIYAVPTRFMVPVLLGNETDLAGIDDISSLADFVAATRSADHDDHMEYIMGELWPSELATYTLQGVSSSLVKKDGTLDEQKLRQYFTDLTTIYENNEQDHGDYYYSTSQYEVENFEDGIWGNSDFNYEYDDYISIIDRGCAWLESGQNLLQAGNIMDMESVLELITLQNRFELDSQTIGSDGAHSYLPMYTYAISSQTPHMDAAGEFIEFLLSADVQASDWSSGIPVSISAYDTVYQRELEQAAADEEYFAGGYGYDMEDGSSFDIDLSLDGVTAEDYEAVKELLRTADTAAVTDNIIVTAILRQASACMEGQSSVDDAVANVLSDINLYLTE